MIGKAHPPEYVNEVPFRVSPRGETLNGIPPLTV
jgi:hypothetical protein